ncbi:hypothetical protein [Pseudomonas syringae group genomosp. 7]|uniref:hypothetical protein n=1 Tax=Pseudomonas syringae group genomosp. 7 TaxID=251699 RepID=UPI00376FF310
MLVLFGVGYFFGGFDWVVGVFGGLRVFVLCGVCLCSLVGLFFWFLGVEVVGAVVVGGLSGVRLCGVFLGLVGGVGAFGLWWLSLLLFCWWWGLLVLWFWGLVGCFFGGFFWGFCCWGCGVVGLCVGVVVLVVVLVFVVCCFSGGYW